MTVPTSINSVVYRGNGATTAFAVPFKVLNEDHLVVTRRDFATGDTLYTYIGTDFSYSGIGDEAGTLTLAGDALGDDYELVIERIVPYTQDLDIVNAGGFYPETVEEQLDLTTMGMQQIAAKAGRAISVQVGDTAPVLGPIADYASKVFGLSEDAERIIAVENNAAGVAAQVEIATDAAVAAGTAEVAAENAALVAAAAQAAVALMKAQVITAKDAALLAAFGVVGLYDDLASGEAATVDGDVFFVVEDGVPGIQVYLNNSGSGVLKSVIPNTGLAPFTGNLTGGVFRSLSTIDGDGEWQSLSSLADQPALALDIITSSKFQVLGSDVTKFTAVVDGDEMVFTNTASGARHCWLGYAEPVEIGVLYYMKATLTNLASSIAGLTIGFTTTAPVPGGAAANLSTEAYGITYRENGVVVAYDYTGSATDTDIVVGSAAQGAACPVDAVCEVFFVQTDATSCSYLVRVDGQLAFQRHISGLTPGTFFCPGVNLRANGQEARLQAAAIYAKSLDVPLRVRLDADAPDGGDGSPELPFNHCDQINDLLVRDKSRRQLIIDGEGLFEGQGIRADLNQWRDIKVSGGVGKYFEIDGSEPFVPSGGWSLVAPTTDVYKGLHPGYDDNNATYGGLIDVTDGITDSFGRSGEFTIQNEVIQNRVPPNTAATSPLFVNGAYGSYSVQSTGGDAGYVYFRTDDGSDPTGKTLRWMRREAAINFVPVDDTIVSSARVELHNMVARRGFIYNVRVERALCKFTDVWANGGFGYGFELNHSSGMMVGGGVLGTGQDNMHWGGGGTALDVDDPLTFLLFNVTLKGGGNRPSGGVGDNISNHNPWEHRILAVNCEFVGAGKDAISTAGAFTVVNCKLRDAFNAGVSLTAYSDVVDQIVEIIGGEAVGNRVGAAFNLGTATNASGYRMRLKHLHFEDNEESDIECFASGSGSTGGQVELFLCTVDGPRGTWSDGVTKNRVRNYHPLAIDVTFKNPATFDSGSLLTDY